MQEQKAAQEKAEYLRWKTFLSAPDDESTLTVNGWLQELRQSKSVLINDLADRFKVSSDQVVERIRKLQESGRVQGIFDRGCFIAVTDSELKAIVDKVKKRGNVSSTDLTEISTALIETRLQQRMK
jgi:DNA-binding MarR family transcriptional regulator